LDLVYLTIYFSSKLLKGNKMQRICKEMREINEQEKNEILEKVQTFVDIERLGVYEHLNKHYEYVADYYGNEYFIEVKEPLKMGLLLNER